MARNYKSDEVKKAIEKSGGLMSTIAKRLNCEWHTAKRYVDQYELHEAIDAEREAMLDMTEQMLFKNIQNGDTTSIIFMLKTQGKKRGYIDRQLHDITSDGKAITTPTSFKIVIEDGRPGDE